MNHRPVFQTMGRIALALALAGTAARSQEAGNRELSVTVSKSVIVDSPVNIQRISVANGALAEAVAITPREVVVNGIAAGETSLIIWQEGGNRLIFDMKVLPIILPITAREVAIKQEMAKEFGPDVNMDVQGSDIFLRGTVKDMYTAERALTIAGTLGKPVNLLNVKVPQVEPQILLKVRFADVDRGASQDLGMNLFSTGAANTVGTVSTGGNSPPQPTAVGSGTTPRFTLTDALNVFLFRPDLNLGTTIRALEGKRLLQILAEPNLLTINGKSAAFLAGGEFPYPTLQGGGGGLGAVTIQFREFGIRINFLPVMTPRGTIRLAVTPEVSALDYANGLTFSGFTIPGLNTRRVQTEVELEDGQSFAIGGLLDNRLTESLSKIPGLGDIPFFGKLFRNRTVNKNNTELLVLVTPEIIRPLPKDQALPQITMPREFLKDTRATAPRHPGLETTGPVPVKPVLESIPFEQMKESQAIQKTPPAPAMGPLQFVPVPMPTTAPPAAPPAVAPAKAQTGAGSGQ